LIVAGAILGIMTMGVCANRSPVEASGQAQSGVFTLTKTGDPATFTQAGDVITYTYQVSVDLSGRSVSQDFYGLVLTDDKASVDCPRTSATGRKDTFTCTASYTVTEADVVAGSVTNVADASGGYLAPEGGCCSCGDEYIYLYASDSFTATLTTFALELTKTGTPAAFMGPDEQIAYEYLVQNTGTETLPGPVQVTDDLVDVTCPGGDLAPGESLTCTANYTTTAADVAAGEVTNNAAATMGEASDSASFTVVLEVSPELELEKEAEAGVFTKAGELIRYSFTLTNSGNVPLEGPFELQDELLDQYECPDGPLAPGASMTCIGYYRTREGDLGTAIRNCARARGYYLGSPVRSQETCVEVFYQPPQQREGSSACDIDPESIACYCEQNPGGEGCD
jgi:hypothetical protein